MAWIQRNYTTPSHTLYIFSEICYVKVKKCLNCQILLKNISLQFILCSMAGFIKNIVVHFFVDLFTNPLDQTLLITNQKFNFAMSTTLWSYGRIARRSVSCTDWQLLLTPTTQFLSSVTTCPIDHYPTEKFSVRNTLAHGQFFC